MKNIAKRISLTSAAKAVVFGVVFAVFTVMFVSILGVAISEGSLSHFVGAGVCSIFVFITGVATLFHSFNIKLATK